MHIQHMITCLEAVLLGELAVLLHQGVDAVNHLLDQLHLGVAQPVLVGDVVSHTCAGKRGLDRYRNR